MQAALLGTSNGPGLASTEMTAGLHDITEDGSEGARLPACHVCC